jgi:hypothetical protein
LSSSSHGSLKRRIATARPRCLSNQAGAAERCVQWMPLRSAAGWRHAPANCLQASGLTHQQAGSHQRYMHNHLCTPRDCMQHMCHPCGSIVPAGHYLDTFRLARAAGVCPEDASAPRSGCMHASTNARSAAVAVRRVNAGLAEATPRLLTNEEFCVAAAEQGTPKRGQGHLLSRIRGYILHLVGRCSGECTVPHLLSQASNFEPHLFRRLCPPRQVISRSAALANAGAEWYRGVCPSMLNLLRCVVPSLGPP